MTPSNLPDRHHRGVVGDRGWWIGAAVMFAIGAGSAFLWWLFQTFNILPILPRLLP
jgi:hypothetical protein